MKVIYKEEKKKKNYRVSYNKKHGITPTTIVKPFRERLVEMEGDESSPWLFEKKDKVFQSLPELDIESLTPMEKRELTMKLKKEMRIAAQDLNFELAAEIRDKIKELEL